MTCEQWLITGATGQLGGHLVRLLLQDPVQKSVVGLSLHGGPLPAGALSRTLDLRDCAQIAALVERDCRPTHIVHTAAMTAVGDCHARPEDAERVNVDATRALAEAARRGGVRLVHVSSDMVFGGDAAPYRESDPPRPLSHYGRTKAAAEREALACSGALVVRVPLLYGYACNGRINTFSQQMEALRERRPLRLFTDEHRTPVHVADAARALIACGRSELEGVLHVSGPERLSRFQMVERFAALEGIRDPSLAPISRLSIESAEPRPADLSLDGSRFAREFAAFAPVPISASALQREW